MVPAGGILVLITPGRVKAGARIVWRNVDQLLSLRENCDLLLIDEAAGIPMDRLLKLLAAYPRVAMATTVHGYEGTGRGFMLRFVDHLDRLSRGWQYCKLAQPIRWPLNDPVENTTNRLLVLDAELASLSGRIETRVEQNTQRHEEITQTQLACDESLLKEVFSLLVLAHYRTRPNDVKQLLDNPAIRIFRAYTQPAEKRITIGMALVVMEGGLTAKQDQCIFTGKRRPVGHLLPSILSGTLGLHGAACCRVARIMRIVIHPAVQRRGLGRNLLRHLQHTLSSEVDLLGVHFSLSPALISFWRNCGYRCMTISVTETMRSGCHNGVFLLPVSDSGKNLAMAVEQSWAMNFPDQLASVFRAFDLEMVITLTVNHPGLIASCSESLLETSIEEACRVCFGARSPESSAAALRKLTVWGLAHQGFSSPYILIERLLQGKDWKDCRCLRGDEGAAQGREKLVAELRQLLVSRFADKVKIQAMLSDRLIQRR